MIGLKVKAAIVAGFLVWSAGLYYTGKYVAFRELSQGVASKYIDKADKQAREDVKKADQSLRQVSQLERDNEQLRRLLSESVNHEARSSECDLNDDELRILNSIVERSQR